MWRVLNFIKICVRFMNYIEKLFNGLTHFFTFVSKWLKI
jgi:hypothetical protein